MPAEYDYGNARLRAMHSQMFDGAALRRLARGDLPSMTAGLAVGAYREDLEQMIPRRTGVPLILSTVRLHLGRVLRKMRRLFHGRAAQQVDTLVRRWDVRDLRTLLRGHAAGVAPDDLAAMLAGAGALGDAELRFLAGRSGPREVAETLLSWNAPDAATARAVWRALGRYEAAGDPAVLEQALDRAFVQNIDWEGLDPGLETALAREIDAVNLLTALRLRGSPPEVVSAWLLPAGRLRADVLTAAAAAADPPAAADLLLADVPAAWRPGVDRWARDGGLVDLSDALDEAVTRSAVAGFTFGDPLGIDVPVAFTWAAENEARNLRIIATALEAGIPAPLIEDELIIVDDEDATWRT